MSLTPMRAIRAKCLDCSGGSAKEVSLCPVTDCPLWTLRLGRRPETIAEKHPALLDERHVQLAGVIEGEREIGGDDNLTAPKIQRAVRRLFGHEQPDGQLLADVLAKCSRRKAAAEDTGCPTADASPSAFSAGLACP